MALSPAERLDFRRMLDRLDFAADDERVRFFLKNPRTLEAIGNGQLDLALRRAYFPSETPIIPVKNMMNEAVARQLVVELGRRKRFTSGVAPRHERKPVDP